MLNIQSRPVQYSENGSRIISASETMSRLEKVLLQLPVEIFLAPRTIPDVPLVFYTLRVLGPQPGSMTGSTFFGKGLTAIQARVSAGMEFIERYYARRPDRQNLIRASYRQVREKACDPRRLTLPEDTTYHDDLVIDWVWGHSLNSGKKVLVPANFVFCPYLAGGLEEQIADYDSNGLAAGNCLEEAILHGILEVVERDALMIMEYNRLIMPDVILSFPANDELGHLIAKLERAAIRVYVKDMTNDLEIFSMSALLKMERKDGSASYAIGTGAHLTPRTALNRALTEALQGLFRSAKYAEWLSSGPIEHLYQPVAGSRSLQMMPDQERHDLKSDLEWLTDRLARQKAEIIVVRLNPMEEDFAVVRVCIPGLQPITNPGNARFSNRLYHVPVEMGWRSQPLRREDIQLREIAGCK